MKDNEYRFLVVEADAERRRTIVDSLHEAFAEIEVAECKSTLTAPEKLELFPATVVIVGPGFPIEERVALYKLFAGPLGKGVAIIAACDNDRDPAILISVRSGAHAAIVLDGDRIRLKRTVSGALKTVRSRSLPRNAPTESIVNLAWLLERIAGKLESRAQEIRNREQNLSRQPISNSAFKRAVVSALDETETRR